MICSTVTWKTERPNNILAAVCAQKSRGKPVPADMIQYLSSRDGSGGDGRSPLGSPASLPRHRFKPASGRDSARDGRNQCITDYFKPAPKQDRTVLCSPEKRNGKAGLSVSCTEHLRKNISSPKQSRRKKILPPPDRSPIIEAFCRGVKLAKKDSPDNGTCMMTKAMYPKVVVRKLFISDDSAGCSLMLKDNTCTRNLERSEKYLGRTRTPLVENTRECKIEYVDPDITSSGLSKLTFTSKHDSLKKESFVSWCQKTACSTMLQSNPVSSSVPLSLETLCRERQLKKEKKMQCKQQAFGSVHKTVETTLSDQDTRDFLRKRSSSTSLESSSEESSSKQASKAACSSELSSNKAITIRKSLSCPPVCSNSRISLGIPKYKERPEKRKRISSNTGLKNSLRPVVQMLEKYNVGSSLEKHNSECSNDKISPGCDVQLEDSNPSSSDFLLSTGYICVEENEESLFSKESKGLLSCTQSDGLLEALAVGIHKRPPPLFMSDKPLAPSIAHNSISKVVKEKTWKDASVLPSKTISEPPVSLRDGNNFLFSKNNDCEIIPSSLCDLNETNKKGFNQETSMLNRRCLSDSEDEISDYNLDSSDDEEVLLPLEEIMTQASRPSVKNPERTNDEDDTQDIMTSSQDLLLLCKPSLETEVSYMNRLEHLLKEEEEFRRVDELERQLQQIKRESEINFSSEEQSSDGELLAEQRAFIERFSVISDAIPDQHPGENIFQIAHAGKLFSQHNLDLRNSGFCPQNPIEKYLLGSGITQQLFVILEGLLTSAYHCSPCPVPILKWMFQMMSAHSDSSVSRRILDILMTLTIKNVSAGGDQRKSWIPSLFDIATVLINMGVPFSALFPLQQFQPSFTEDDIMSEIQKTMGKQTVGDTFGNSTSFFLLTETNLCNVAKFLRLCISIYPECYTDEEIFLLLLVLFKLSLEKELKQFPLVDLECLIIKLLENIREWDAKMSELCLAISYLSSHHHDLLWLVQFVPNWITRGRQVKRHLSLVIISKLLKNHVSVPNSHDQQMSLLCKDLVKMKPSNLLKRLLETVEHQNGLKEAALSEFEPQAYYLTYVLLHLVREASNTEITNASQRKWLVKLCSTLEKHVKCDIREDARLFYRTKVKDLVARTYSKWQQMICSSQLAQGTIHDWIDLRECHT